MKAPVRLLILTTHLTRDMAGAAKAISALACALHKDPDFDPTLCCVDLERNEYPADLKVVQIPPISGPRFFWRIPSAYLVSAWEKALRKTKTPDCNIVYANSMHQAIAWRRLHPEIPIISHGGAVVVSSEVRQELQQELQHGKLSIALEAALCDRLEARMYREPQWIHLVSAPLVARVRAEHFGIRESDFVVRPYGIDPDRFQPAASRVEAKRTLGLDPAIPVIITTARLIGWKRVDMVLEALSGVNSPFQYVVVGTGPSQAELEARAQKSDLAGRVRFAGWSDPVPYLQAGDLFVLPSTIESFGLVYAEAMMTGLACIGSRHHPPEVISSTQDVIQDGVTGFLAGSRDELREKLVALLADRELREKMGIAGRERALREFSLDSYVAHLKELIRDSGWVANL